MAIPREEVVQHFCTPMMLPAVEENCFRIIHAEINAIVQAAKSGTSIEGAVIYVTHSPCLHCLKVIINAGIKKVYYRKPYKLSPLVQEWLQLSGVCLEAVGD